MYATSHLTFSMGCGYQMEQSCHSESWCDRPRLVSSYEVDLASCLADEMPQSGMSGAPGRGGEAWTLEPTNLLLQLSWVPVYPSIEWSLTRPPWQLAVGMTWEQVCKVRDVGMAEKMLIPPHLFRLPLQNPEVHSVSTYKVLTLWLYHSFHPSSPAPFT